MSEQTKRYRYRPRDNRTPVNHPTIGHLEWDGIYSHPDCAGNPDFEEIREKPAAAKKRATKPAGAKKPAPAPSKAETANPDAAAAKPLDTATSTPAAGEKTAPDKASQPSTGDADRRP